MYQTSNCGNDLLHLLSDILAGSEDLTSGNAVPAYVEDNEDGTFILMKYCKNYEPDGSKISTGPLAA